MLTSLEVLGSPSPLSAAWFAAMARQRLYLRSKHSHTNSPHYTHRGKPPHWATRRGVGDKVNDGVALPCWASSTSSSQSTGGSTAGSPPSCRERTSAGSIWVAMSMGPSAGGPMSLVKRLGPTRTCSVLIRPEPGSTFWSALSPLTSRVVRPIGDNAGTSCGRLARHRTASGSIARWTAQRWG